MQMHAVLFMLQDNGLTFTEVLRDVPHDGPAVLVYGLVAVSLLLVWRGSRQKAE